MEVTCIHRGRFFTDRAPHIGKSPLPDPIYHIIISLFVCFSDYKKYFSLNLESKLKYKGYDLVRHDTFFWGQDNSPVKIKIDKDDIDGFIRVNGYQVIYKNNNRKEVIEKLKKGNVLKIDKHFWNNDGKKEYPNFSLIGFTNSLSKLTINGHNNSQKDYPVSGLHCKKRGPKKIVWINTSHGSYALNGQAIDWVKSVKMSGSPLLGSDGKPMKIGRNHMSPNKLTALIKEGLRLCD